MNREREISLMEAHLAVCVDGYMNARPHSDNDNNRRLFEAGFSRGFYKARELQDESIQIVAKVLTSDIEKIKGIATYLGLDTEL